MKHAILVMQAKPCKHLWVGGISPTVSKEELEEEFLKFGKIEDFKFLRDRNTAFVEFLRLEDASQAMRNMNGMRLGGDQIRVDFLRSQPSRRVSLSVVLRDMSAVNKIHNDSCHCMSDSCWLGNLKWLLGAYCIFPIH